VTLHKFPAALALSSILVKGGEYSRKKILVSMFIFALATPIGALVSMNVMDHLNPDPIGFALGISAGTFLYISIGDLLPTVHEEDENKNLNLMLLFVGILVMFLSTGLEG
jgi:zinc transporter ZupT